MFFANNWKFVLFLVFIVYAGIFLYIYRRTGVKSELLIAFGGILMAIGSILWIVTNNIWIFIIFLIMGLVIDEIGLMWDSFTESATKIPILKRLVKKIYISNEQYKPIEKEIKVIGVIGGAVLILIGIIVLPFLKDWSNFDLYFPLLFISFSFIIGGITLIILIKHYKKK